MTRLLAILSLVLCDIWPTLSFSPPQRAVFLKKRARTFGRKASFLRRSTSGLTSHAAKAAGASSSVHVPEPVEDKEHGGTGRGPWFRDRVVYRTSVLPPADFDRLIREARSFLSTTRLLDERASSVAVNRQGVALPQQSPLIPLLDRSLSAWIRRLQLQKQPLHRGNRGSYEESSPPVPIPYVLSPHVPVELRVYQRRGASMAWHVDDVLYDPPQLEVVFTLENTSDCATLWRRRLSDAPNPENSHTPVEQAIETDPNSALLLAAGGAPHGVTSLTRGKRTIAKLVYVQSGARYLGGPDENGDASSSPSASQFAPPSRAAAKKQRQRKQLSRSK